MEHVRSNVKTDTHTLCRQVCTSAGTHAKQIDMSCFTPIDAPIDDTSFLTTPVPPIMLGHSFSGRNSLGPPGTSMFVAPTTQSQTPPAPALASSRLQMRLQMHGHSPAFDREMRGLPERQDAAILGMRLRVL